MSKIFKEFNMTEKEYHHARYNLTTSSYVIYQDMHEDSFGCKVLYFDADDGVALISHYAETFDDDGFTIKLVDCNYCDIRYGDMLEIILLFEEFNEAIDKKLELLESAWTTKHYTKDLTRYVQENT